MRQRMCAGAADSAGRWLAARPPSTKLWETPKAVPNLVYSAKEGSWDDLLQMGQEMCKLYELKLPRLPIVEPSFQLNYHKEVFPNSPLANLLHRLHRHAPARHFMEPSGWAGDRHQDLQHGAPRAS